MPSFMVFSGDKGSSQSEPLFLSVWNRPELLWATCFPVLPAFSALTTAVPFCRTEPRTSNNIGGSGSWTGAPSPKGS